ncbi:MAG: leucyl aminopeptidase [Candidatus Eutrophobiaceae bacterium]
MKIDYTLKIGTPENHRTACVIVGVFANAKLSGSAEALDLASGGSLAKVLEEDGFKGAMGQSLLIRKLTGITAQRILCIGLGEKGEFDADVWLNAIRHSAMALTKINVRDTVTTLPELAVPECDATWKARQAVMGYECALYRFVAMKSSKPPPHALAKISIGFISSSVRAEARRGIAEGVAIANGTGFTRDLGNLPGNICTPDYLAKQARKLARSHGLKVTVLDEEKMRKHGMGSLLSVSRGSHEPGKLIILEYYGKTKKAAPVVLVGKGVTFDTGGISLKPASAMDEMKFDMCGAASVFGALRAVAEMKLPLNLIGVIPTVENMPDGKATKPGDIVKSLSGRTIEVLNTDAEGRLILCDALTWCERYQPKAVIDIATLTGACVIALGKHATGMFSNEDKLAEQLLNAGERSRDRAWRLPLWKEYRKQLSSPFADIANIGGREGGAVTAACFLSYFTEKYPWAHLDIAGTAWLSGIQKGATGRPVGLLTQFLIDLCNKKTLKEK